MTSDTPIPTSAGLSSYNLLNEKLFFTGLALKPGMNLLDYGCGVGNYALAAAPYVGDTGQVYAVDLWEEGIEVLEIRTAMAGFDNIQPSVCGAGERLPLGDHVVDVCLLATVVHILFQENLLRETLREIKRVLKPGGRVAIVEFYKQEGPPGPPLSWRLAPQDLQQILASFGLTVLRTLRVGSYNYLSLFNVNPVQNDVL